MENTVGPIVVAWLWTPIGLHSVWHLTLWHCQLSMGGEKQKRSRNTLMYQLSDWTDAGDKWKVLNKATEESFCSNIGNTFPFLTPDNLFVKRKDSLSSKILFFFLLNFLSNVQWNAKGRKSFRVWTLLWLVKKFQYSKKETEARKKELPLNNRHIFSPLTNVNNCTALEWVRTNETCFWIDDPGKWAAAAVFALLQSCAVYCVKQTISQCAASKLARLLCVHCATSRPAKKWPLLVFVRLSP